MAQTISRTFCPKCNKRNLSTWEHEGKKYQKCMTKTCETTSIIEEEEKEPENSFLDLDTLDYNTPESYRGLTKETCELGNLKIAKVGDLLITEYLHINSDNTTSLKRGIRPQKKFFWKDKTQKTSMYMLHLQNDFTKPLYITEGGEDTLTLIQLGFQAASIHSANSEEECIKADFNKLIKYPYIVLCLDADEAGTAAKEKIINLLVNEVELREINLAPYKDCNDYIKNDIKETDLLLEKIQKQRIIAPEGLIFGSQIDVEELYKPLPEGVSFPFSKLNSMVRILPGDLIVLTGGVSIGKSTITRRLSSHFRNLGMKLANLYVEESKKVSQLNYIAESLGYPIGELLANPHVIPKDKFEKECLKLFDDNSVFISEFWERTTNNTLKTIKYLAKIKKYDIIVLDHITSIISGTGVSKAGKVHDIDFFMEEIFNICKQTRIIVILVSHLKRPHAPPYWDEGRRPSMYDLKGAGNLEGKPDIIIGFSRNMKNPETVDVLQLEVLKNRWFSKIGDADQLIYIQSTGRLK